MIQNPIPIVLILLAVVSLATRWSHQFQNSKLMRILPTPVWCYMPPTILTTFGILPMSSPVYDWISTFVLPACIILLLMMTNLQELKMIGKAALVAMACASFSVLVGATGGFFLFRSFIGPEAWKAVGTITASWIGGTANMIATKQAVGLPEPLFVPLFIADITTVYIWMTFLMMISSAQNRIDGWLSADHTHLNQLIHQHQKLSRRETKMSVKTVTVLLAVGFGAGAICVWMGNAIPEMGRAVTHATWTIILVTAAGLWLSASQLAQKEGTHASQVGYFLLYWVLAAAGAKAHLLAIVKAPLFLVMALLMALVHGTVLFGLGRMFRIPIALLATSSQANLGSVSSAPIVASTYEPKLVPVALILAILGNAAANYLAILFSYFLKSFG